MDALFGWFGALMEWFGELIPRLRFPHVNEWYLTLTRGKKAAIHESWFCYWPVWSDAYYITKARIVDDLETQTLMDLEGQPVIVDAVMAYKVVDCEKFLVLNFEPSEAIGTVASAAVRDVIVNKVSRQIQAEREEIDDLLTQEAQSVLDDDFGIEVEYLKLTSFAHCEVKNLLGDIASVNITS